MSRQRVIAGWAGLLVSLVAACGGPAPSPTASSAAGPGGSSFADASVGGTQPSAAPVTDLRSFDADVAAAFTGAAAQLPGASAPIIPGCSAAEVTYGGAGAGSIRTCDSRAMGAWTLRMTASEGSTSNLGHLAFTSAVSNEAGTHVVPPGPGDAADFARSWNGTGCDRVLAVRSGRLVVVVSLPLEPTPAVADCWVAAPDDTIEAVMAELLDRLTPYGAIGAVVDDPARRQAAVDRIAAGKLRAGPDGAITLPPDLANLSDTGQVIAAREDGGWTIVFFKLRGFGHRCEGWLYSWSGTISGLDPDGGTLDVVERLNTHWFRVTASSPSASD